ncbi:MAG: hypothetical protein HKN13_06010 [Rhodothermales bacterium]|nr:hypothetical protein [Rhodothermales bacterium]
MYPLLGSEQLIPLIEWLYTYLLHSTVLLGGAWLIVRFVPLHSSRAEEYIWKTAAFGALATATVVSFQVVPGFLDAMVIDVASPVSEASFQTSEFADGVPTGIAHLEPLTVAGSETSELTETGLPSLGVPPSDLTSASAARYPLPSTVLLVWLLGVTALTTRFLFTRRRFLNEIGPRTPIENKALLIELENLREAVSYSADVRVTESFQLRSAVVIGRDEICLPTRIWKELSVDEQRSMLAHEFAHVIRRDPLWLQLFNSLCAIFFMQPLNFVARRRYRSLAEFECDTWVVRTANLGTPLASCLVKVARWFRGPYQASPYLGIGGSPLRQRIERILSNREQRSTRGLLPFAVVSILLLGAFVPAISLHQLTNVNSVEDNSFKMSEVAATQTLYVGYELSTDTVRVFLTRQDAYRFRLAGLPDAHVTGEGEILMSSQTSEVLRVTPGGYIRFAAESDGRPLFHIQFESDEKRQVAATYSTARGVSDIDAEAADWLDIALKEFATITSNRQDRLLTRRAELRQREEQVRMLSTQRLQAMRDLESQIAAAADLQQSLSETKSSESEKVASDLAKVRSESAIANQIKRREALQSELNSLSQRYAENTQRRHELQSQIAQSNPTALMQKAESLQRQAEQARLKHERDLQEALESVETAEIEFEELDLRKRKEAERAYQEALAKLEPRIADDEQAMAKAARSLNEDAQLKSRKAYAQAVAASRARVEVARSNASAERQVLSEATAEYARAIREIQLRIATLQRDELAVDNSYQETLNEFISTQTANIESNIQKLQQELELLEKDIARRKAESNR